MKRVIVIAAMKKIGYQDARSLGIEPVAVVTPRSKHSAYGITADVIMDSTSLSPEDRDALLPFVLPSIATSRA